MAERITPRQFHDAAGVDDWRDLGLARQISAAAKALGVRAARTGRNRIHIDVGVPHDQAEARVAAALAAGGSLVEDRFAPAWWTLADPEGNEVDLATWIGRD
jgi:hypothetical protein